MADFFTYQRKRRELGKPCNFQEVDIKSFTYTKQNAVIPPYVQRNPNHIILDNIAEYSEHSVNTERVSTRDQVMFHKEGGWPQGIDPAEATDQNKYRRRFEKDSAFAVAVNELKNTIESCIKQNNQIDLFEEYFLNEESEHQVENLSTKTLMLFKDQNSGFKRGVTEISWHPEGPVKAAVSYAITRFQQMPEGMSKNSYVWDLQTPNSPEVQLESQSPLTNLMYNPRLVDQIGGGCYNGLVAIWDVKKGKGPAIISPVEKSHHDPVTHFQWLFSKTGTECVTTSTDGRALWWDTRQMGQGPVESLNVLEGTGQNDMQIGATVLEYNVEAGPTKFVIGTEMGSILIAMRKPKKPVEISSRLGVENGRHLGPIVSINRSNPNPKYFLSVGDWSAKIWVEDIKTPIMRTKYHGSYLTDGCWSPTRNGVFFLTRKDGWMDVWDYYYRQNEIAFSHKVSETALTCIKINSNGGTHHHAGRLVAIGDQDGTVTLLELCDSLYQLQPREKDVINEMFEREARKEKNLNDAIKKQQDMAKRAVPKDNKAALKWEQRKAELISEVEQQFSSLIKKEEEKQLDQQYKELDSPKQGKKEKKQAEPPKEEEKKTESQKSEEEGGQGAGAEGEQQGEQEGEGQGEQEGEGQGEGEGQQQGQGEGQGEGEAQGEGQQGEGQQQGGEGEQEGEGQGGGQPDP